MHRKRIDQLVNGITYLFSSGGVVILAALLIFIFMNGYQLLSWDLLVGDYYGQVYDSHSSSNPKLGNYADPKIEGSYFSATWGIALKDAKDKENQSVVIVSYVDEASPMRNMVSSNEEGQYVQITPNQEISKIFGFSSTGDFYMMLGVDGAESIAQSLDQSVKITSMITISSGGGIRGSILTTLYLIGLTLLIALPLGVIGAIYLHELSSNGKITMVLRNLIDLLTGIPSIVFGLLGAMVFIPLTSSLLRSDGGNLLSGALTLSIILLPTIIKTTEENLMSIPKHYRDASYALGASKSDTIFKIVLPNAVPGILTAILLSIARIIGESAALIYAIGTAIKDEVSIGGRSTSLAVHIWSLMAGESPNVALACTISLIILIVVFALSIILKALAKRLNHFAH